ACNDHQIRLTGRGAKNLRAKAGDVVAVRGHGHHLDGAAGEAESKRPEGVLAGPVDGIIELGKEDAFVLQHLGQVFGLVEGYFSSAINAHRSLTRYFLTQRRELKAPTE